jgi:hypothetical protein
MAAAALADPIFEAIPAFAWNVPVAPIDPDTSDLLPNNKEARAQLAAQAKNYNGYRLDLNIPKFIDRSGEKPTLYTYLPIIVPNIDAVATPEKLVAERDALTALRFGKDSGSTVDGRRGRRMLGIRLHFLNAKIAALDKQLRATKMPGTPVPGSPAASPPAPAPSPSPAPAPPPSPAPAPPPSSAPTPLPSPAPSLVPAPAPEPATEPEAEPEPSPAPAPAPAPSPTFVPAPVVAPEEELLAIVPPRVVPHTIAEYRIAFRTSPEYDKPREDAMDPAALEAAAELYLADDAIEDYTRAIVVVVDVATPLAALEMEILALRDKGRRAFVVTETRAMAEAGWLLCLRLRLLEDEAGYRVRVVRLPVVEEQRKSTVIYRMRAPLALTVTPTVRVIVTVTRGERVGNEIGTDPIGSSAAYARRTSVPVRDATTGQEKRAWAYVIYMDHIGPQRRVPSGALARPIRPGEEDPRTFAPDLRDEYVSFNVRVPIGGRLVPLVDFPLAVDLSNSARFAVGGTYSEVAAQPGAPWRVYVKLSPAAAAAGRLRAVSDVQRIYFHPIDFEKAPAAAVVAPITEEPAETEDIEEEEEEEEEEVAPGGEVPQPSPVQGLASRLAARSEDDILTLPMPKTVAAGGAPVEDAWDTWS